MSITIRPAEEQDIAPIVALVNHFAAQNVMLPRTEASVRQTLADWLVAIDDEAPADAPPEDQIAGCASLVALTTTLVEVRSLAINKAYQGYGVGSRLVLSLIEMARAREMEQICALTLRASFFTRMGFEVVDRWSISPKVWQACIYCSKFHHCDEVAVLMPLVEKPSKEDDGRPPAWNGLLRYDAWQPLKLAYQKPDPQRRE